MSEPIEPTTLQQDLMQGMARERAPRKLIGRILVVIIVMFALVAVGLLMHIGWNLIQ